MWNVIRFVFCLALVLGQRQTILAWGPGLGELSSPGNRASETAEAIEEDVVLQPRFINFGEVEKGRMVTRTLKLTAIGTVDIRLENIETAKLYFSPNVWASEDSTRRVFKIETVLKSDAPAGSFSETMTLHTNSGRRPTIEVPVYGNVVGKIRVKPQTVLLGVMEKGSHATDKLEVSSVDRKRFNILEIVSKPSFVSAVVTRATSSSEFEITYKVADTAPPGKVVGEIKVRTDDLSQPFVDVPVRGLIAPPVSQQALKTERSPSMCGCQASKHVYITRPPVEEDTYLSAWLIKRFVDPTAEFAFAPIGSFVPEGAGCIFDLPSPYARWIRANRRSTSEHVLLEIKEVNLAVKKMVDLVRQLEMGAWLVTPRSDAGRLRSTITEMTQGIDDPQARLDRVLMYFDDVYIAGGCVPQ